MKWLIPLLFLTGCAMNQYQPKVLESVDHAKYEADRQECIQYSKDVRSKPSFGKTMVVAATGMAGYAMMDANKDKDDPFFKDGYQLTDECMTAKGYTVIR